MAERTVTEDESTDCTKCGHPDACEAAGGCDKPAKVHRCTARNRFRLAILWLLHRRHAPGIRCTICGATFNWGKA